MPSMLVALLLPPAAVALAPVLEVRDMPYQIADRVEGVYGQWSGRWTNGPVYRRMEASFKYNSGVSVFLGPFCGYVFGAAPSSWCLAQCEEEHMLSNPGLLLPCGVPAPDGTDCPPPEPEPAPAPATASSAAEEPQPPAPSPRLVHCSLLGHARKWHEAGKEAGTVPPPPEYWRLNLGYTEANWVDASNAALDTTFSIVPRTTALPPPGERLRLRKDRTLRTAARAELCLGAERGALTEGVRLIFWDCGHPPYRHELFVQAYDAARGGHVLRLAERPELCASLPAAAGAEAALVLGRCDAAAGSPQPAAFAEAEDGTLRLDATREACLGTGADRPDLGSELRASPCAMPAPAAPPRAAAPEPASAPAAQDSTVAVLQAVQAFQQSLEARMDARVERLEREVAELRASASGGRRPEAAAPGAAAESSLYDSNKSACTAFGCSTLPGSLSGPRPFGDL